MRRKADKFWVDSPFPGKFLGIKINFPEGSYLSVSYYLSVNYLTLQGKAFGVFGADRILV